MAQNMALINLGREKKMKNKISVICLGSERAGTMVQKDTVSLECFTASVGELRLKKLRSKSVD